MPHCSNKSLSDSSRSSRVGTRSVVRTAVAAVLLSSAYTFTHAQIQLSQIPDSGRTLGTVPQGAPSVPGTAAPVQAPEQRPAAIADANVSLNVTGFRLSGNTVFSNDALLPLLKDLNGKRLTFAELQAAAGRLTAHYRKAGYLLALAYIPRQDFPSDGVATIDIAILEGRLGKVTLKPGANARLSQSVAERIANNNLAGADRLLNNDNVMRTLLLMNDLPGVTARGTLRADGTPGSSEFEMAYNDGPWLGGSVDFDNAGSRYTGQNRIGGGLSINDPLGIGDQFSLRALQSANGGLHFYRAGYSLPLGGSGLRLNAGASAIDYRVGKEFSALGAKGDGHTYNLGLTYPVIRLPDNNLYASLNAEQKTLSDRDLARGEFSSKRLDNVTLGAHGDFRDSALGTAAASAYSLVWTSGKLGLRAPGQQATDQTPGVGRFTSGRFNKWAYQFSREQIIVGNWSVYGGASGQFADKNLDTAEKFSLGGPTGVRAYPVNEVIADEAIVGTIELRYRTGFASVPGKFMLYALADSGTARVFHSPLATDLGNRTSRSGQGFGLEWAQPGNFSVRASVAWRNGTKPTSDTADYRPRVTVTASKSF